MQIPRTDRAINWSYPRLSRSRTTAASRSQAFQQNHRPRTVRGTSAHQSALSKMFAKSRTCRQLITIAPTASSTEQLKRIALRRLQIQFRQHRVATAHSIREPSQSHNGTDHRGPPMWFPFVKTPRGASCASNGSPRIDAEVEPPHRARHIFKLSDRTDSGNNLRNRS